MKSLNSSRNPDSSKSPYFPVSSEVLVSFLILAGVFLLLRMAVLFTGLERVCHYDELDLGTMAREIQRGLKLPLWKYQVDAYSGESLILGLLTWVSFQVLGPTLMAVKMVPLFFALLTFSLTFFFIFRFWGLKTAKITALLLIFCPPSFVQFSMMIMSGHSESLALAAGVLWSFYEVYRGASKRAVVFFGILSGLSVWFYNQNLIFVLACLCAWWGCDRKIIFKPAFLAFAASFCAGFSPWIIYNVVFHFPAIKFWKDTYSESGFELLGRIKKVAVFLFFGFPSSFNFFPVLGLPERGYSYVYFAVWAVLFLFCFFRARKKLVTHLNAPVLLYPVIFSACFILSPFTIQFFYGFVGSRYLTPLYFGILILTGIVLAQASKKLGFFAVGTLILLGALGQTSLIFQEPFGLAAKYRGFSYYQLGIRLQLSGIRSLNDFESVSAAMEGLPESEKISLYSGMTWGAALTNGDYFVSKAGTPEILLQKCPRCIPFLAEWKANLSGAVTAEAALKEIQLLPSAWHKYFWQIWLWNKEECPDSSVCKEGLPGLPKEYDYLSYWGLGSNIYNRLIKNYRHSFYYDPLYLFGNDLHQEDIDSTLKEVTSKDFSGREWVMKGLGQAHTEESFYSNVMLDIPFKHILSSVSSSDRQNIYYGLGWGIRHNFREDRVRALAWIQQLPIEGRPAAEQGLRGFESWYGLD